MDNLRERTKKMLPKQLQKQILEACEKEADHIRGLYAENQKSIEVLKKALSKVKAEMAKSWTVVKKPDIERVNILGKKTVTKRDPVLLKNEKTVECNQKIYRLNGKITHCERWGVQLISELNEVEKIRVEAELGIIPVLLHLTDKWRSRDIISYPMNRIIRRRNEETPSDSQGNPLPNA